ncbi:hypothetical protein [Sorangium cellulosum]|uniref:Uncharacterized protein n=1 Tax=Sorangium cellulosum So0157-2 TaxID=1254432 RepID=S4XZD0_SORCE|nr:hypothetical protein [Sorangium cellulosum]AGP38577.1 hypothetical protein SCE1572_31345 [Sorangium cellulosum So0157-2]
MPVWPIVPSPPPQQADVDRALDGATAAWLVADSGRRARIPRSGIEALRPLLRLRGEGAPRSEGAGSEEPALAPVTLELERHGRPSATVRVAADLSIQLAWDRPAPVEAPAALRAWLVGRGAALRPPSPERGHAPAASAAAGEIAPPGTTLVAAASSTYRRLCTDGARVFAIQGWTLVRLQKGQRAHEICPVFRPDTPIAIRAGGVLLLDPSGRRRLVTEDGEARPDRRPLFGLPALRLRRALPRFVAARDAALARLVPDDADLLPLDPGHDACDAYEAFGGALPAALRLRSFWGCDVARGLLHEVPARGAPRQIALGGRPAWLGATGTGVLVVVARDGGEVAVLAVDAGAPARSLGAFRGRADGVLAALCVGGEAWLRLAAPPGGVVVALEGAGGA